MKRMKKWLAVVLAMIMLCTPAMSVEARSSVGVDMFKSASTIKGMQGISGSGRDWFGGIEHTLVNIHLDDCIFSPTSKWATNGWVSPYTFEGETFYFGDCPPGIGFVEQANQYGMSISVVFLVRWTSDEFGNDSSFLIDSNSLNGGYTYYAPNADLSTYGGRAIRAYWHFLMEWCQKNNLQIDNMILGNEVNMPNHWHHSGSTDPGTVANKYADAFYWMYDAAKKYNPLTRCSISVDHSWNHNDEGRGITVKDFLYYFDSRLQSKGRPGGVDWCMSLHLYPAVLNEPKIWEDTYGFGLTTNSSDTQMVDGSNLSAVTNYIRDTYGEEHRIMLTEQGFTSNYGDAVQAAALAYSYYAAMYDPMVDCFLLNVENAGGLDFSIAGRTAEYVYTRIGNGNAEDAEWIANVCLPVIGVGSWSEIVPNYGQNVNTYQGAVTAQLKSFELAQQWDYYYFSGELVITEVIDGVATPPRDLPIVEFMSACGTQCTPMKVTLTEAGTYAFEMDYTPLSEDLEYVIRVTSGSKQNVSEARSLHVNLFSSPDMPATKAMGKVNNQKVDYYRLDNGEMRIYGRTVAEYNNFYQFYEYTPLY